MTFDSSRSKKDIVKYLRRISFPYVNMCIYLSLFFQKCGVGKKILPFLFVNQSLSKITRTPTYLGLLETLNIICLKLTTYINLFWFEHTEIGVLHILAFSCKRLHSSRLQYPLTRDCSSPTKTTFAVVVTKLESPSLGNSSKHSM